jgi:hypothetical protein
MSKMQLEIDLKIARARSFWVRHISAEGLKAKLGLGARIVATKHGVSPKIDRPFSILKSGAEEALSGSASSYRITDNGHSLT